MTRIDPTEPNAIKFERFIFDLLPLARRALVVEAAKQRAFAPVKNASGMAADTPETARAAMVQLDAALLARAGACVDAGVAVEVNPLWALDAAEASRLIEPDLHIREPTYFR